MLRHFTLVLGALAFLALAAHSASAVDYRPYLITDLGDLDPYSINRTIFNEETGEWELEVVSTSGYSKGWAVSESGNVAGFARRVGQDATPSADPPSDFAFYWSDGTLQYIGDVFGNTCTCSPAKAIQDIGGDTVVMGAARQDDVMKLWTWNSTTGIYTSLGSVTCSTQWSTTDIIPTAMNESGVIVGRVTLGTGAKPQAFYHLGGTANTFVDIGSPIGYNLLDSEATDINSSGVIVGFGRKDPYNTDRYSAFIYDIDTSSGHSINVPGWHAKMAYAINDQGWMLLGLTASSTTMSGEELHVWDGTTTHATGLTGAHDINNQGQVVGSLWTSDGSNEGAQLYDVGTGETTRLWDLLSEDAQAEWSKYDTRLGDAYSINEAGQITGYGYHTDYSAYVGFFMTPTLSGDANIDGSVNGTDLNTVLSNYNATISGDNKTLWIAGDFNCDGSVNGTDLNTVLSNYNQSISFASTAAVPEPSTLLLMALGLLGLLAWRRK